MFAYITYITYIYITFISRILLTCMSIYMLHINHDGKLSHHTISQSAVVLTEFIFASINLDLYDLFIVIVVRG